MKIETRRLSMRHWRASDFEFYASFFGDEDSAKYMGGALSRDKAWRSFAAGVGHWELRGYGMWAVESKASGRLVGGVGLWRPEGWPELEVGYWLAEEARGRGFAAEAAIRSRQFAYENLGVDTLVSYIHPDNAPSQRVARSVGAVHERDIELLDYGVAQVFRHPGRAGA